MPRERQALFRETNTKPKEKIIVLAFEGNVTEEAYFEELKSSQEFNDELIYLHLLKRAKTDTNSAPKSVFNKLKKEAKDEYNFNKGDELWMIIDKDKWRNIPEIIELCNAQGNMFVAGSNPCFEFWLLLHVKKYSEISEEDKQKLFENRRVTTQKNFIDSFLSQLLNGYNKKNPRPERFLPHISLAIDQAKALDTSNEDFPSYLGSHVYRLAEKLKKQVSLE